MKHLNIVFITVILLAVSLQTTAQEPNTVVFSYDDSGNRTKREAIFIPSPPDKDDNGQQKDETGFKNQEVLKSDIVKHTANVGSVTINIFPNPNGGMFKVSLEGWEKDTKSSLIMHSLSGKEVTRVETLRQHTNIDISSHPNGTYILTIFIDGKKEVWKIVKN
nr:T9SS type A sorting domain-containing protein [Bacteroidota bacterium]